MIKRFFFIQLLCTLFAYYAVAGLPPTTTKASGDSTNQTTFNFLFPNFTVSRSGVSTTFNVNGVAGGGTGAATFTAYSPVIAGTTSTGAFQSVAAGTTGQFLQYQGASAVPTWATLIAHTTGEVFMTAATSCPSGSIAADGSSLLRTGGTSCGGGSCANLFAAISTTYGAADGTHFTLPDTRGVFIRGQGSQTISSITYTGTQGTTQGDQMQGHLHNVQIWDSTLAGGNNSKPPSGGQNSVGNQATGSPITDGSNGTPRTGSETRPANISLKFCIVY